MREWSHVDPEARQTDKAVHSRRLFGIIVDKAAELQGGDPRRKAKCRAVGRDNEVVTQHWEAAVFQNSGPNPSNMEPGKAGGRYACMAGLDTEQTRSDTWFDCRRGASRRPKCQQPDVPPKRALHGHPDSGTHWEKHCHRAVGKAGLCPTSNWPPCPFHDKLKLFLVVYVGDFKHAGPSANLAVGRALPRALLQLEDPAPAHLYWWCLHEQREATTPDNASARAIVYNMEDYLRNTVAKYSA